MPSFEDPADSRLFKILLETLGPEDHLPTTLFLLAERCCQNNEKSKTTNAQFGADLLNSFPLSTRLTVCPSSMQLIVGYRVVPEVDYFDSS